MPDRRRFPFFVLVRLLDGIGSRKRNHGQRKYRVNNDGEKEPTSSGSGEVSSTGCSEGELYAGWSAGNVCGDRR